MPRLRLSLSEICSGSRPNAKMNSHSSFPAAHTLSERRTLYLSGEFSDFGQPPGQLGVNREKSAQAVQSHPRNRPQGSIGAMGYKPLSDL